MPTELIIEKEALEAFLKRLSRKALESHSQLVAHFGFFLTEELGETDVTPKKVRACYDAAQIEAPANIADTMRKSNSFVQTQNGTLLRRDARSRILESLTSPEDKPILQSNSISPSASTSEAKSKNVVVVHGRDLRIPDSMFQLLRSVGLTPVEWNEAVRRTGRGSPYTGEVVDALFTDAQAVVVLLNPEEYVELRQDLRGGNHNENSGWQPRPNVLVEAGMALARDEAHTILVQIGVTRIPTDLAGRNLVYFDGSAAHRHNLIERLRTSGCTLVTTGSDWLRVGDFTTNSATRNGKRGRGK